MAYTETTVVKNFAMERHGGVELMFLFFVISELDGQYHTLATLLPGKSNDFDCMIS
jgi:hypothetical protein